MPFQGVQGRGAPDGESCSSASRSPPDHEKGRYVIELSIPPAQSIEVRARWLDRIAEGRDSVDTAVEVANHLQTRALELATAEERARAGTMVRLARDPSGLAFVTALTDQSFRPIDASRVADQIRFLIYRHGAPSSFSRTEQSQLRAFGRVGGVLPALTVPTVLRRIHRDAESFILPMEEPALGPRLAERAERGVAINLNLLGEAILGENEARRRMERLEAILSRSDIASISVKVSSIASQLDLLSWDRTVELLADRLEALHEQAIRYPRMTPEGRLEPKLVYLDMESYGDLRLTVDAFMRTLSRPRLAGCAAGIALQAYLPESFAIQRELTEWAARRVEDGGERIRIRLVKGANLASEAVDASLKGLALPIYPSKLEVDANFRRMVEWGAHPERVAAARLGIASHNVFDLAHALVMRGSRALGDGVGFELLEGMNEPMLRALLEWTPDVLVYAPAVVRDEAESAIAYLMRRLDENTGDENILCRGMSLTPGSEGFGEEERSFRASFEVAKDLSERPRRRQDRREPPRHLPEDASFENEPDTDWALPHHRSWALSALAEERGRMGQTLPVVIDGEALWDTPSGHRNIEDPSRPGSRIGRAVLADWPSIDRALDAARRAQPGWEALGVGERSRVLAEVARRLRAGRAELIGAMVAEGGKRVVEADAEVSEAIDFAEYYRRSLAPFAPLIEGGELLLAARGVVLVAPPWNFPLAIPAGGVLAALMGGNAVVLKPAPETPLSAHRLATILWESGVPGGVLSFVPCDELEVGDRLIGDPRIDAIVLTGSSATAREFQWLRPERRLMAETGGKNASIVTAMADRDQAIAAVVRAAFGHAGQKCSATSLLICEGEIYDDPRFRRRLADAASSLRVGSAWDPGSVVTPLIRPPEGLLLGALGSLEEGESWLLEPQRYAENERLVSPGIRLGVKPGSPLHREELFGPVLSMMRARNLDDAISIANQTPYGLTASLFSLDPREQELFIETIEAGNVYVNRGTTGAIVRRQPFGGWKASSFGPGAKAGGPNYVLSTMRARSRGMPSGIGVPDKASAELLDALLPRVGGEEARARLRASARSYAHWQSAYFDEADDPSRLRGQDNFFRYRALRSMLLVAGAGALPIEAALCLLAASSAGVETTLDEELAAELGITSLRVLANAELGDAIRAGEFERVRVVGESPEAIRDATIEAGVHLETEPPVSSGRVELLRYHREQSITIDYHRHGNLGERAREGH